MRRKDREVTDQNAMMQMMDRTQTLHMALFDGEYPYIVPLHFGYEWKDHLVIYMHSAKQGHKLDLIRQNSNACIEIENDIELISAGDDACEYSSRYSSIIAKGTVEVLEGPAEKIRGLQAIMKHQTGRDFAFDERMVSAVEVMKFTASDVTCKVHA